MSNPQTSPKSQQHCEEEDTSIATQPSEEHYAPPGIAAVLSAIGLIGLAILFLVIAISLATKEILLAGSLLLSCIGPLFLLGLAKIIESTAESAFYAKQSYQHLKCRR